jgi:5-methylcytosine-specific restriction enzyme B
LIPKEKIVEIVAALASGRHVLLAGPIGTGKTRLAKMIPELFWEKSGGYFAEDYTATADWNTQDVIGGIYPKMENGKVVYDIQYGCVAETVSRNWEREINGGRRIQNGYPIKNPPYRGVWLVIDEFNRADIDKAFGQLFTALRTRSLKIPTSEAGSSFKDLKIPLDYRIIGTLNTADKHFLFQLSDALKSRFAYIEVDVPKSADYEKEIYYAMKNAISELRLEKYEDIILLNLDDKKVLPGKMNPDFYNRALHAYYIFESIRVFKKLGTAILQLVYQNMLVAFKMTGNTKLSLDNALTSTLTPQLENLSVSALGAINALYSGDLSEYFRDAYKGPNRQSFVHSFENVVEYLQLNNHENLSKEFRNGNLKVEDANTWAQVQNAVTNKRKNFELELDQFRNEIAELMRSAVV